ncbi:lytic transglycosylase domain-containing protein [Falsirhodobacter sp. 20TX0035]|uniref:lytic transglycosylase domain-containing protein n=1 Tax=Falsirhodobacter sp. 20TX0035 TaxID=3022019 RepID=UPI00232F40AB|nr:lytic transglycosylase domain-containing protein [Falsirhodobacter sp. 20TX0035]MDB6453797.1 lytic transglycosylase domain-containing protein [Falsirhodobacter sp. 20TX0035]
MLRTTLALTLILGLAACGGGGEVSRAAAPDLSVPSGRAEVSRMVDDYADRYGVPRALAHRVVKRESTYNPAARNGTYYGLMQIAPATARIMGFRGEPTELLDAETNLTYAMKYLRGAWMVSNGSEDRAVEWYSKGYYYEAKRKGLLEQTGLRS